ncbi:MAG: cadherin-like beta sandwich domain-containing protein, partial [Spirochaetales bacterium]|nr:cadherin-like beta sandwich domain-containing protein [Spirochaetales bacterium]
MRKGRTDRPISAEMLLGILAGVVLIPLLLAACSLSGPQEPSANADLQDLGISSGTLVPAFAPGATAYTVGVADDVESVTVTAAKASPRARIEVQANGSGWEEIMSGSPCSPLSMDPGMNTVEVRVTAEDTVTSKVYTIEVYRLSAEALLDSLAISAGTLDPAFESQTVSYGSSVANAADTTTVTAVATDYRSTLQVQVNGGGWQSFDSGSPSPVLSLIEGDNLIEIKVTAEDGVTSSLYTITVHRISANAELSALAISAGTLDPVFDASTTSYSATVDSGVGFLKVTTSPADAAAAIHVQANGGVWQLCAPGVASSSLWLDVGDNTVSVRVTAEDGITRKTYTIAVRRLSGNAQLASLMVSPGTLVPAFSSATAVYASTVTGVDGSMTVTAAVADALPSLEARMNAEGWQALSSGSPSPALPLVLGSNTLEVRVTAEDPAVTQVYTVSVARRCPGALDVEFAMLGGGITARALALQADGKVLVGGSSY